MSTSLRLLPATGDTSNAESVSPAAPRQLVFTTFVLD